MPKQYFILIVTASSSRACAFLSFGLITHLAFYHIYPKAPSLNDLIGRRYGQKVVTSDYIL